MEQNGAELLEGREINWERNQEEEEKKGQPCQTLEVQAGAELGSLTQTVGGGGGGGVRVGKERQVAESRGG